MRAPIRIALRGATGRLGGAIAKAAERADGVEVVAALASGTDLSIPEFDVLVDATLPDALPGLLAMVRATERPVVVATTGYDGAGEAALDGLADKVPVVRAPNLSTGVAAVAAILPRLTEWLAEYDVELVEMHHRRKRDAPSGTAAMWLERVRSARTDLEPVYGREGETGPRTRREVGVHALRGGTVVGEHRLVFAGDGERVEIIHRAESREAFAQGAIRAVRFACSAAPGLYDMTDVLGLGRSGSA